MHCQKPSSCDPCVRPGVFALSGHQLDPPVATAGEGWAVCKLFPENGPWGSVVCEGVYDNLSNDAVTVELRDKATNVAFAAGTLVPVLNMAGSGSFSVEYMLHNRDDIQRFQCCGVTVVITTALFPDGEILGTVKTMQCEPLRKCVPPCEPRQCGCKCFNGCKPACKCGPCGKKQHGSYFG